jgi:hypothetical protein
MNKLNKEELIKTIEEQIQQTLPDGITIDTVKNNLLLLDFAKKYDKVTLIDGRIGEFMRLKKNYKFLIKINGDLEEVYVYQLDKIKDNPNKKTLFQRLSAGNIMFIGFSLIALITVMMVYNNINSEICLIIAMLLAIITCIFFIPKAKKENKEYRNHLINTYERLKGYTLEEIITNNELSKDLNGIEIYQLKNIINGDDK